MEAMVFAPEADTDLLKTIEAQLARLVQTIRLDEDVHPEHVSNAEKHASELVLGFTKVLQQARQAKTAKQHTEKLQDGIPPCRLRSKQPLPATAPLPEIPTRSVRHSHKQPQKIVPDDVFLRASRPRMHVRSVRSRSRGRCHSADAI